MPELTDAHLWRFVDGELAPADAAAVEQAASTDSAIATARLRGAPAPAEILEMRQFVRRILIAAAIVAAVGLTYMAVDVVPDLVDRLVAEPDPLLERP